MRDTIFPRGIRGRLLLLLLIVFASVLLGEAAIYSLRFAKRRAAELQVNLELARTAGKAFETFVQQVVRGQGTIGLALTASPPPTEQDRNRLLDSFQAETPGARSVSWLTPSGKVVASSLRSDIGHELSDRAYVHEILAGQPWAMSGLIIDGAIGKPAFAISRGIRTGQGTLAGIVATFIEPDQLDSVVGIERAKQGGIGLIDKQGLLVYRSIPTPYTLEQRNFLKRFPIMAGALQGKEVLAEVTALSTGEPRLVAFAPVPTLGWVVSAGRPAAEVQRPIKRVLLLQAGTLLAVVLVGLGAAVSLARPIANGLIALRRQALAVGRDEIPQVAAVSGPKEITELAAVFNDMAAAVRAREAALRLSEQKFAKAFAANPAAIALTRFSDGRILDVNDTSLAVLGYRREEVIGRAVNELGVWCDPGGRSRYLEALRRDGHVRDWEVLFSNKSGQPVDVLLAAERITVNGEELILSTFLDITTRKQAQARLASQEALLRTILEQAAEEIVVRDAQGRLLLANAAVRRHALPAPSGDVPLEGTPIEAVPHLWGQMLDTDGKPIRPEAYPIARVLRDEHVLPMEFQRVAPDGQVRTLLHSVAPLRDSQDMLIGAVAISIEITAQKQKEAELRQAHAELEQRVQDRTAELSQAVQQLERKSAQLRALASELTQAEERERERLAMLLHDDLQQLLIGMKLVVGPLAQAADPKVRAVGGEVSDLLQQALHCSRSLTEELSPPILHRSGLVPALNWLANWMEEKYHLTVAVQASGPILIESHETAVLLFRVIRELLFNTAKHAQTKSATVEIAQRDDLVRACVSDAGVGFEPSKLRMAGGTAGGVGLFNIHERLVYLGGGLEVESAPEKGSRFTLWLPVPRAMPPIATAASVALEETETSALGAESAGPAGAAARKIRVLVVDDHSVVRQGLVRLLTEAPDIEVVGDAADGQSAIALAANLLPDVITMDVNMPGLDGVEATRRIHAAAPVIQIIGLSVYEEATQAAAMRAAGAVNYLTKSVPAEGLLAAIRARVRSSG